MLLATSYSQESRTGANAIHSIACCGIGIELELHLVGIEQFHMIPIDSTSPLNFLCAIKMCGITEILKQITAAL